MYQEGTDLEDKELADYVFKMNMYILVKHKHPFDPYRWNRLTQLRIELADFYYWAVSIFGEDAFLNKT